MFVSQDDHEQRTLRLLGEPGARYWPSVELGTEGPWFVLVRKLPGVDLVLHQTLLAAWGGSVATMLRERDDVVSVQCMVPEVGASSRWAILNVVRVWVGREAKELPPLFEFDGLRGYRDEFLSPHPAPTHERVQGFPRQASGAPL